VAGGTRITALQRPPDGKVPSRKWRHLFDGSLPESGGPPLCTTYHKLLLRPIIDSKTEELQGWQTRVDLDRRYKLICCDEASMISDDMLGILQARGVPVLAVGDHGQLSPVKASGKLMQNPMLRLEQIHRQAEGSSIIALARHVREGGRLRDFKGWNEDCQLRSRSEEEAVVRETLTEPNRLDVAIIAWTNKTRVRLNRLARQLQGYEGPPVPGEPIVALHNYYPVCNGMRGLLTKPSFMDERRNWILHAHVEFPDDMMAGEWHEMNGHQFNRPRTFATVDELHTYGVPAETLSGGGRCFDFGYCLTCHKAQGSQFDHVVVIYERDQPSNEEARRWAYTALSRAARSLTVLA
jgi:exodeoxyribonuclease-5